MTREELIAALEKARESSRHLDEQIALVAGWRLYNWMWWTPEVVALAEKKKKSLHDCGKPHGRALPYFTSSIDAAMTLPPNGWMVWEMTYDPGDSWDVYVEVTDLSDGKRGPEYYVIANHPLLPIAICIAALKARVG